MKQKAYYPHSAEPLHEVKNWACVRSMIRTLRNGGELPPVYIDGPVNGGAWLSGTHRVAAAQIREQIDGTNWRDDLTIVDLSGTIEGLTEEERGEWAGLENEDAISFLLAKRESE